jgi:hypothetical protein
MQQTFPSVFKAEVFRPLAVTVIPGALAISPWVFAFNDWFAGVGYYRDHREPVYYGALLLIAVAVGLLIEDIGSQIEARWFDRQLQKRFRKYTADHRFNCDVRDDWYAYLQLTFGEREPIGQHYLRSILLRAKFSLSFGISLLLALLAFAGLSVLNGWHVEFAAYVLLHIAALGIVAYCWFESYMGFETLAKTRRLLVDHYGKHASTSNRIRRVNGSGSDAKRIRPRHSLSRSARAS